MRTGAASVVCGRFATGLLSGDRVVQQDTARGSRMSSEIVIRVQTSASPIRSSTSPPGLMQLLMPGRKHARDQSRRCPACPSTCAAGEAVGSSAATAGKSTLLQIVCGTLQPSSGEVCVAGGWRRCSNSEPVSIRNSPVARTSPLRHPARPDPQAGGSALRADPRPSPRSASTSKQPVKTIPEACSAPGVRGRRALRPEV